MTSIDVANTLVGITNNTTQVNAEKAANATDKSEISSDAFLQLLIAQLKNQDPLNPTDSNQFLQQQAQFTQISELQKLNKSVSSSNQMMQASSLIGKEVSLTDPNNSNSIISGVVSEAVVDSKGASVVIGNYSYPLDNIISIKEATKS